MRNEPKFTDEFIVEVLERRFGDVHGDGDLLLFTGGEDEILVQPSDGGSEPRIGFTGGEVHHDALSGRVAIDDANLHVVFTLFRDIERLNGADIQPIL